MKKNVTLIDVAKACGTSNVTVSNALAGKKGVSSELRDRILKTAEEMGYAAGRPAPVKGSSLKTVGVLIPSRFVNPNGSSYLALYNCLVKQLKSRDMLCLMENLEPEDESALRLPLLLSDGRISALISLGQVSDNYARMLIGSTPNLVMLDYYIPSINSDRVISNGYIGGYKLCSYLIKMGHKKIGFIGSRFATSSIFDRYMGYLRAMIENGLPVEEKWTLEDRENGLYIDLKFPDEMPTAFICNCDEIAYNVIRTLKSRGYSVPEDISVVGYDNYSLSDISDPAITTINVDPDEMAELTVAAIVERFSEPEMPPRTRMYEGELIIKQSVKTLKQ